MQCGLLTGTRLPVPGSGASVRWGLASRILGRQTSSRRPRIRSVRTELTMSGACEATVLLEEGNRVRAAAARLELLRERWILTGLEIA